MNQKSATFVSTKESFQEAVIGATNQLNDFLKTNSVNILFVNNSSLISNKGSTFYHSITLVYAETLEQCDQRGFQENN